MDRHERSQFIETILQQNDLIQQMITKLTDIDNKLHLIDVTNNEIRNYLASMSYWMTQIPDLLSMIEFSIRTVRDDRMFWGIAVDDMNIKVDNVHLRMDKIEMMLHKLLTHQGIDISDNNAG